MYKYAYCIWMLRAIGRHALFTHVTSCQLRMDFKLVGLALIRLLYKVRLILIKLGSTSLTISPVHLV